MKYLLTQVENEIRYRSQSGRLFRTIRLGGSIVLIQWNLFFARFGGWNRGSYVQPNVTIQFPNG